jgi:hypothetical protein
MNYRPLRTAVSIILGGQVGALFQRCGLRSGSTRGIEQVGILSAAPLPLGVVLMLAGAWLVGAPAPDSLPCRWR